MRTRLLVILAGLGGLAVAAYPSGFVEPYLATFAAKHAEAEERAAAAWATKLST